MHGPCALDLDDRELPVEIDHQIGLRRVLIAPVEDARAQAPHRLRLEQLARDPRFDERAAQRVHLEHPLVGDPEQRAREPRVDEVQLRRLHQPLIDVAVPARDELDDVGRLEDRHPCARSALRDSRIGAELREIHQLPGASGAERKKPLEVRKVAHAQDVAHIALDVGGDIRVKPGRAVGALGLERGISALDNGTRKRVPRVAAACRKHRELKRVHRQHLVHRNAARQRLGDALREQKAFRPRKNPSPHAAPSAQVAVDVLEQVRHDLGRALDLVEHGPIARLKRIEESARILQRHAQHIGRLHHGELVPGKQAPHQRRLAALPRAHDSNRGKRRR